MFGTNWTAHYYNNTELKGFPVYSERLPAGININWGMGSPSPLVHTDNFSARFHSVQVFDEALYEFAVSSDSGVRVFFDNSLILDQFIPRPLTTDRFQIRMTPGIHEIQIEYFAGVGQAAIQVMWFIRESKPAMQQSIKEIIPKVFISYSRSDWPTYVQTLVAELRQNGIDTWVDQHLIEGGDDWLDRINQALEDCTAMVLCVSPQALASKWVKMEYRYFIDENKLIVPILLEETKLPVELRPLQHLRYGDFAELVKRLSKSKNA
ncbi:MAG: TIR domain-containing protein [Anaerolineae bacterium]|nr:TIR domain-containing protein [Anaerolineae bacterium]